jgi:serine/threonine protein kinase
MTTYDGWELLQDRTDPKEKQTLGHGGQGVVYLARSPRAAARHRESEERVKHSLRQNSSGQYEPMELAKCLWELGDPDFAEDVGALKQFSIPSDDKEEEAKAVGRLEAEVHALQNVSDPAVLRLLHSNLRQRFLVTEYHQRGTLDRNLSLYRGNSLVALEALRPLVKGVMEIHKQGAIHRDIKTENIFLSVTGNLVLGDFGIVFFQAGQRERLTSTFGERVGSHFWMAPWAYDSVRIEFGQVRPTLDVYPLGKVLWAMISGRNGFPYWEYAREENNLTRLFPDDPIMPLVNAFLAKCIVREEQACLPTAEKLLSELDGLISEIKARRGYRPDGAETWPCRMCGKGAYHPATAPSAMPQHLSGRRVRQTLQQATRPTRPGRDPLLAVIPAQCEESQTLLLHSGRLRAPLFLQ